MKTPLAPTLGGQNFKLQVIVHDRRENRSEPVTLPLSFSVGLQEKVPEQPQAAAEHRLGGIMIDIATYNEWRWFK